MDIIVGILRPHGVVEIVEMFRVVSIVEAKIVVTRSGHV
jgi:hypothetical protein